MGAETEVEEGAETETEGAEASVAERETRRFPSRVAEGMVCAMGVEREM